MPVPKLLGTIRYAPRTALAMFVLLLGSCSDAGEDTGVPARVEGRGTAACHDWQTAYCGFVAKRCALQDQATCAENAGSITCSADELAEQCVASINTATCASPPVGCDLGDVADRAIATAFCEQYVNAACDMTVRCGGGTYEACQANLSSQMDCSRSVGASEGFEQCLSDFSTLPCSATAIPSSCDRAIKGM